MHSARQAKKRATSSFVGSSETEKNDYNLEEARNSNDDVDGNNGMDKEKRQVSGSTDFVTFTKQQRPLANALMNTAHYYLSLSLRSPRMNSVLINSIIFSVGLPLVFPWVFLLESAGCYRHHIVGWTCKLKKTLWLQLYEAQ